MLESVFIVGIYVVILFILSIFAIEKAINSYEEYGYCGRALSIAFIIISYFGTWIGGGTIVGLVARSYQFGANQYWVIGLSCVVELFFAVFFIAKIRGLKVKTIAGFFAEKYQGFGEAVRIPVTAGVLIRNVTMVAMQFGALSYLITFIFGINRNLSLLIIFLVITLYTVMSGLWGVVMTDVFQGILQTLGLIILVAASLKTAGGIQEISAYYVANANVENLNLFKVSLSFGNIILYVAAFGLFFLMNDQANWERIYASSSDKTAKWGFIIPIAITMITLVFITYLGVFQQVIFGGKGSPGSIIYDFVFNFVNSKAAVIIIVGLIAAIMSSADSFLLASGTMVSENIIKRFIFQKASDREMIFWTRIFIVVSGSVSFAFALSTDDILSLWFTGIGMTSVILVPGYLMGWFAKRPDTKCVFAGMGAGILYVMLMMLGLTDITAANICIGMSLNLFTMLLCQGIGLGQIRCKKI